MGQTPALTVTKSEPLAIAKSEPLPTDPGGKGWGLEAGDTGGIAGFARETWQKVNPIEIAKGLVQLAKDPVSIIRADPRFLEEAQAAAQAGDYPRALRKAFSYMLMGLGPETDRQADMMDQGRYAEAVGAMTGTVAQAAIPVAVSKVPAVRGRIAPRNVVPEDAAAVQFGMREGIPVDAATATGNPVVRGAEWLAERTIGGSRIGQVARRREVKALHQTGDRLAGRTHATPVTQEQAGAAVTRGVEAKISDLHTQATQAYDTLRQIEAQATPQNVSVTQQGRVAGGGTVPVTTTRPMRLAVDTKPAKSALDVVYQRLKREAELVPLQGGKARALVALDRLMNGPDFAPLSVVDAALGDLKAMARGADLPELRTQGQGVAAIAVQQLDAQVMAAASREGPAAVQALLAGRRATVAKHAAADVFDALKDEPVRAAQQLTAPRDASIAALRDVQKWAPQELPKLGRAVLDELTQKIESGASGTAHTAWEKLGPESKRLLFRDPAYVADLDNYFRLAKKMGENPNPSGSGFTAWIGAQGSHLWFDPVSGAMFQLTGAALTKALHSPRIVRLLVRGFRMPVGNRGAATVLAGELGKATGDLATPVPAGADREADRRPRGAIVRP